VTELGRGAKDTGRALEFLRKHPRLWKWLVAPAIATGVLLAAIIVTVLRFASSLIDSIASHLPDFLAGVGSWVLWAVIGTALVLGGLLVFVSVVGIVAGSFNELLSEAVEEQLTGKPGPKFSLVDFVSSALRGVVHGIRRLFVTLFGIVLVFALGFIPVIGTIAALIIGGWLAARGAAYDCYDAVLSRRSMSYGDKAAYLARHRDRTLGLGIAVAGMLLVPGLNLIALGIGATGATLAAHELAQQPGAARAQR
jgi:CysZ protein